MKPMERELFDTQLRVALENCIAACRPFAACFLPRSCTPLFFASEVTDEPADTDLAFVIAPFGPSHKVKPIIIRQTMTLEQACSMKSGGNHVHLTRETSPVSTSKKDYIIKLNKLIDTLKGREAKVVYSRIKVVSGKKDPVTVAEEYFKKLPQCMRAIYFTPQTGLWIVATPELLIESSITDGRWHTMSLAGTRKAGEAHWDQKNIIEHELVTRYIVNTLHGLGLSTEVCEQENLCFGPIEHLCNHIYARGNSSIIEAASALSPTPAVCGWPVEEAFAAIKLFEAHRRECYGGYIGLVSSSQSRLYVNLRCCKVLPDNGTKSDYILYAGGGINGMSEAECEWFETESKLSTLYEIISNNPS